MLQTLVSEHGEPASRSEVIHAVDQPLLKIGQCYPNPLTPACFYVTCDTESFDINQEGRLVPCLLKCLPMDKDKKGQWGANTGGMRGTVDVVFIACELWLGAGPCLNIVI